MSQMTYKNVVGPKVRALRHQFDWTQKELARHLRQMGWEITRSSLAKIEARLTGVSDAELLYFVRTFEVKTDCLFPDLDPEENVGAAVRRLLTREQHAA